MDLKIMVMGTWFFHTKDSIGYILNKTRWEKKHEIAKKKITESSNGKEL